MGTSSEEVQPRPWLTEYTQADYAALVLDERRVCRQLRDADLLHYAEQAAVALDYDAVSWLAVWMRARLTAARAEWQWRSAKPLSPAINQREEEWKREAKARVDLLDVVAKRYVGKPSYGRARQWQVVCPLHDDRSPSLSVDGERGLWYCFGCNTGGDVLSWWTLVERMDFVAALHLLEETSGLARPVTAHLRPVKMVVSDAL